MALPPFVESDGNVRCGACGTVNRPGGPAGFGIPPGGYGSYGGANLGPPSPGGGRTILIVIILAVALPMVLMIVGGAVAFLLARRSAPMPIPAPTPISTGGASRGSGTSTSSATHGDSWEGVHGILFVDVNGDGVPDVVGRVRQVGGSDEVSLAAFDAATGRSFWQSAPVGSYHDTSQGVVGLEQDVLVFCGVTGRTTGVGLHDGKTRWTGVLPEKATALCKGDRPGEVRAVLADGNSTVVRLADGRAFAPVPRSGTCARLPSDEKDGDPSLQVRALPGIDVNGMTSHVSLQRSGGPQILLGYRSKGTQVPMMAAVYPDPSRSWKSDLPATNPLETDTPSSQLGVVTATRACTHYGFSSILKPHVVVCFDLAGHRLWETPLTDNMPLSAIQSDDHRVFVSQWNRLTVLDAARGSHLYTIGRP
jgi:hypothetical protein